MPHYHNKFGLILPSEVVCIRPQGIVSNFVVIIFHTTMLCDPRCLSFVLSVCLYVCLSICLSVCLSVSLYISQSVCEQVTQEFVN